MSSARRDIRERVGLGAQAYCAVVCSKEKRIGTILVKNSIREDGRRRFTIAHEIAHYVLPHHGTTGSICRPKDVENWDRSLPNQESEANIFAGELLIPHVLVEAVVSRNRPTFHLIRDLSNTFDTSLTASAYRTMGLTSFRAAIIWSTAGIIRWLKASEEFGEFVAVKDDVSEGTYAYDCFNGLPVPDDKNRKVGFVACRLSARTSGISPGTFDLDAVLR
jgi:hypothetical protein